MEKSMVLLSISLILASLILGGFWLAKNPNTVSIQWPQLPNANAQTPDPEPTPPVVLMDDELRLIHVTGSQSLFVTPTEAELVVGVVTLEESAEKSQSENAELIAAVIEALRDTGIPANAIETQSFSLHAKTKWNPDTQEEELVGYETVHMLKVKITDLDDVGKTVDAAVEAGANRVSSVTFSVSKERQAELQNEALGQAAQNAREKAVILANSLELELDHIQSVNEVQYSYRPYYYAFGQGEGDAVGTSIMPGQVEITASVQIEYVFE